MYNSVYLYYGNANCSHFIGYDHVIITVNLVLLLYLYNTGNTIFSHTAFYLVLNYYTYILNRTYYQNVAFHIYIY